MHSIGYTLCFVILFLKNGLIVHITIAFEYISITLRIESSAIINLRGVSTKPNKFIVFTMQTYKKLMTWFKFNIEKTPASGYFSCTIIGHV